MSTSKEQPRDTRAAAAEHNRVLQDAFTDSPWCILQQSYPDGTNSPPSADPLLWLRRAYAMAPDEPVIQQLLEQALRRAGAQRELLELWGVQLRNPKLDNARRSQLQRQRARALEAFQDMQGAREAWEAVLEHGEDAEALYFMRRYAIVQRDPRLLDGCLRRLARLSNDVVEKRCLLLERATTLANELHDKPAAIRVLWAVVRELDPSNLVALDMLADLCGEVGDVASEGAALERLLVKSPHHLRENYALRLRRVYADGTQGADAVATYTELSPRPRKSHRSADTTASSAAQHPPAPAGRC